MDSEYIAPKEIALRLNISVTTVYEWLESGLIPYRKPKKLYFIRRKDFEAFLNGD